MQFTTITAALTACEPVPRVDVTPSARVTGEDGQSATLTIRMERRPLVPVVVFAESSDTHEGVLSSPVRFDASNFRTPQLLQVRGVDDALRDGDRAYEVVVYARPADHPDAQALRIVSFQFVNRDNDAATLVRLGDLPGGAVASHVEALSQSGAVVVGYAASAQGDEATRYTLEHGLEGLGGPDSRAHGISPDEQLVTGSIADASVQFRGRHAVLWRAASDYDVLPGPVAGDGTPIIWPAEGYGVNDDGVVFGECVQYGAYGEPLACRVDGVAPNYLTVLGGGHIFALDTNDNIAGDRFFDRHAPGPFPAMYNGASLPFPSDTDCAPIAGCRAEARAFADEGGTLVGSASLPAPVASGAQNSALITTGFVYTESTGMVRLPGLAGGSERSAAYAISADARLIGGWGEDADGQVAVVWSAGKAQRLDALFGAQGGVLPPDFRLLDVRGVSADGRIFAGNGLSAAGDPEGYRIAFVTAP